MHLFKSFFGIIIFFISRFRNRLTYVFYNSISIFLQKIKINYSLLFMLHFFNIVKWIQFFYSKNFIGNGDRLHFYFSYLYGTKWKHLFFSELYSNFFSLKNDKLLNQRDYEQYLLGTLLDNHSMTFSNKRGVECLFCFLFSRCYEYISLFFLDFESIHLLDFNTSFLQNRDLCFKHDLNKNNIYISDIIKGE